MCITLQVSCTLYIPVERYNETSIIQFYQLYSPSDINCCLNFASELKKWIEMQNEVAAEPMNAAREKARAAKLKVLILKAVSVSRTVI
jgi:hypothetical protein